MCFFYLSPPANTPLPHYAEQLPLWGHAPSQQFIMEGSSLSQGPAIRHSKIHKSRHYQSEAAGQKENNKTKQLEFCNCLGQLTTEPEESLGERERLVAISLA